MKHRGPTKSRAMASVCFFIAISLSSQILANGEVKAYTQQTSTASCTFNDDAELGQHVPGLLL